MKHGFLFTLLCLSLVGCASYTCHHLIIKGTGTYIFSGIPIQGNAIDDSWSCIGFKCPVINTVVEDVNAVNH